MTEIGKQSGALRRGPGTNADDMVCSGDPRALETQGEEVSDGKADDPGAGKAVRPLLEGDGAEAVQWNSGGSLSFLAQEVLRSRLHGRLDGKDEVQQRQPQPNEGEPDGQAVVRRVRGDRKSACSPHRRGPFQQRPIELEDVVRRLSSSLALAELHGRWRDAGALRALCAAICEAGAVPFTPESAEAIWQSLGREGQDRIRVGFGHNWVTRTFSPLSRGEGARVMRLRGYGNAIVPQQAAEFLRALFDSVRILETPPC